MMNVKKTAGKSGMQKISKAMHERLTNYSADAEPIRFALKNKRGVAPLVQPTSRQLAFHDLELGMFACFGMSTFTGESSGDGRKSPLKFHPTDLDCDQWMEATKAMGAKYVVLTARHEEGFCLWPTKSTDYSVVNSSWKNGRGDVVREFVTACRRHGMKVGLYHPSWHDRHYYDWMDQDYFKKKGPEALARFTEMQVQQVTELLTNYGAITYLWFDHHGCPGFGSKEFWKTIDLTVRNLQPGCINFGTDAWIHGQHSGEAGDILWYAQDTSDGTIHTRPLSENGNPRGAFYRVWETNTIFSGDWFWNGPEVKPVSLMLDKYCKSVGRGTNFLPNFAPDPRGLMTDKVLKRAREFGDRIRQWFGRPIAEITGKGNMVELKLGSPAEIGHIVVMEDLRKGQRIAAHKIEAQVDGQWRGIASGATVGHKRIHWIKPIKTSRVRFHATETLAEPVAVRRLSVYGT